MQDDDLKAHFYDEISLKELFLKVWSRRAIIVLVPVLAGILTLVLILYQAKEAKTPTVYYVKLTTIDKGLYPNGVRFSPQDLKAPEVTKAVAGQMGLTNVNSLDVMTTVSYGSPLVEGILLKYKESLAKDGLSAVEIDVLNGAFEEELELESKKILRISVDHQGLGLNAMQGAELAVLLPKVWADVFVNDYNVLNKTKLTASFVPEAISLRSAVGIIEANDTILNIVSTLSVIEDDNRLQSVVSQDGFTPSDLKLRIKQISELTLNGALAQNIVSGDGPTKSYLSDMVLDMQRLDENIAGFEKTITSLETILSRTTVSLSGDNQRASAGMQISGDAIGEVAALVNSANLAQYLMDTYDLKADLVTKRTELNMRIRKIESGNVFNEELLEDAERKLDKMLLNYIYILNKSREMVNDSAGEFHEAWGRPFVSGTTFPPRWKITLVLSMLVGTFVVRFSRYFCRSDIKTSSFSLKTPTSNRTSVGYFILITSLYAPKCSG